MHFNCQHHILHAKRSWVWPLVKTSILNTMSYKKMNYLKLKQLANSSSLLYLIFLLAFLLTNFMVVSCSITHWFHLKLKITKENHKLESPSIRVQENHSYRTSGFDQNSIFRAPAITTMMSLIDAWRCRIIYSITYISTMYNCKNWLHYFFS